MCIRDRNTLHQGASIGPGGASMATPMLTAMLVMVFAFWAYAIAVILMRVRAIMLERDRDAAWVQDALGREGGRA